MARLAKMFQNVQKIPFPFLTQEVETPVVKKKAKGLWIGEGLDDLDDSDLTDSDDESKDGEEKEKR